MLKKRETEFHVGAHANPFGVKMQLTTIASCIEAFRKHRLGNLFSCNGNEFGEVTGPSQQDLILDTSNAAVRAGVECARRGIHFTYISVDFADAGIVEHLNRECGEFFLGPLKGETSGLPASDWHRESRFINDSNRHLNHNAPPCFARDMRDAKETYVRFLKERFADRYRAQGVKRMIALDQHCFHRFDLEAGFDIPVDELMTKRVSPDLACLRGCAAAFDKPLWGTWIAIGWYGGSNYDPDKPLRWKVCLRAAYMHGSRMFLQESGHFGIYEYGDRNTRGLNHPLSRSYRKTLSEFHRFTRSHARPVGDPAVSVAFLQGNFDGWTGSRMDAGTTPAWMWGQKDSGDHWLCGEAEQGWDLLDLVYPRDPAAGNGADHFSGAPFGQIDIAPATAPAEKLSRYRALVMPSWNTMTEEMYRNLTVYARGGGTLFLGIPQFNTDPDRGKPWTLIHGGDLRELCGVKIGPAEENTKGYLGSWTGNAARAKIVRRSACGLRVGSAYVLHPPRKLCGIGLHGASVVAVSQEGHPVLLEHAVGKGRVLLLALWNWPGSRANREFCGDIVKGLLGRFGNRMKIRGTLRVDWTEFPWNDDCSNIYLLNTNLHGRETGSLAVAPGLEVPFVLAPGEFRILYRTGSRVLWADDPALPFIPVEEKNGTVAFAVSRAAIGGKRAGIHYHTKRGAGRIVPGSGGIKEVSGLRILP